MFTGIIEEIGSIERIQQEGDSARLLIRAKTVLDDLKIGDSVAVNGVCLTVTTFTSQGFSADVMHETLNRSSLAMLKSKSHINLERAMPVNGRFGGHIVAGHVDDVGRITEIKPDANAVWYTVQTSPLVMRYIVEKGSIAIDGTSLTVAKVAESSFSVSVIPHTLEMTVLKERRIGDIVNLETDIIGKYVEKLIGLQGFEKPKSKITREFLTQNGF